MSEAALRSRSHRRSVGLAFLALAVLLMPDSAFSIVAMAEWEVLLLRLVTLLGISVAAVIPWVVTADVEVRRRLRLWSVPGLAAVVAYLFSTDPFFLLIGFCMLCGANLDLWVSRATVASESMRAKLTRSEQGRRG